MFFETLMKIGENKNSVIYILSNSELEDFTCSWEYNRLLSETKVESILNEIKDDDVLESVLNAFYDKPNNKFVIYDGCHRREALCLLAKQNIEIKVMCCVYFNLSKSDVIKKFEIINSNTPIPKLTMDLLKNESDEHQIRMKEKIIHNVLKDYIVMYPKFYNKSGNPRRPNFNDTMFIDLCNDIGVFRDEKTLRHKLEELNANNKETSVSLRLTDTFITKCKQSNFYLFI